jgi:hypothetical protein
MGLRPTGLCAPIPLMPPSSLQAPTRNPPDQGNYADAFPAEFPLLSLARDICELPCRLGEICHCGRHPLSFRAATVGSAIRNPLNRSIYASVVRGISTTVRAAWLTACKVRFRFASSRCSCRADDTWGRRGRMHVRGSFLACVRARDRRGAQQPRSGRSERGAPDSPVGRSPMRPNPNTTTIITTSLPASPSPLVHHSFTKSHERKSSL